MKSTGSEDLEIIVFDDSFGKLNSHWPYSTNQLIISKRLFYDEDGFEEKAFDYIINGSSKVLAFSGKGAANAAYKLDSYFQKQFNQDTLIAFRKLIKVMRVQNTNLSEQLMKTNYTIENLRKFDNRWLQVALDYPFDVLMMQTYGDAEIVNKVLNKNVAYWVPYCYNENKYYPRDVKKDIDVGMFFKLERHPNRVPLVDYVTNLCERRGWKYCFSDKYWGDEYAEIICRSKILLHLSYFGDIPYRLYEAAGSKLCLLTDPLSFGVENIFIPGEDYCEYNRDLRNLETKIEYLLENPEVRERIAEKAYNNVTNNHTWQKVSNKYVVPLLKRTYDLKLSQIKKDN